MQTFSEPGSGTESGPPSASAYKRAVYRQPPSSFSVEVLPPQKHGNNYSYGMRITPHKDSSRRYSTISTTSSNSSSGSLSEYEIWRRWEDCLYFQDLLETQYAIMSREKRARLQRGKGVKKNGIYPHEDPNHLRRAASFESLPPGPDPNMIAKDVHEFLPKLNKKGTLFRASAQTIEQRGLELKKLIEALFTDSEDVPTLIVELRQLRVVRDFFGFWRRDHDRAEKERAKEIAVEKRRAGGAKTESMVSGTRSTMSRNSSLFGSAFGMYFSASNLSLQLPSTLSIPEDERMHYPVVRGGSLSRRGETEDPDRDEQESSRNTRRPHTMQNSSNSDFLRSRNTSTSTAASSSSSRAPLTPSSTQSFSYSTPRPQTQPQPGRATVRSPPASAPAGMHSFPRTGSRRPHPSAISSSHHQLLYDEDGYNSDTPSVPDSVASLATFHTQTTERQRPPRSAPPQYLTTPMGSAMGSQVSLGSSLGFGRAVSVVESVQSGGNGKGKSKADVALEPEFDGGLRLGNEDEEGVNGGYAPVPIGTHHSPPNESVIVPFSAPSQDGHGSVDIPFDLASDRRGSFESSVDPILPSEAGTFGFDDDDHTDLIMREHEDFIPRNIDLDIDGLSMDEGMDGGDNVGFEFGGIGGVRVALQDLIEEEEEEIIEEGIESEARTDTLPESQENVATPTLTPCDISESHLPRARSPSSPIPSSQPIPRVQRRAATFDTVNRNGLVFTSPLLTATDSLGQEQMGDAGALPADDNISVLEGDVPTETEASTPRVLSPAPEKGAAPDIRLKRLSSETASTRPVSTITQSSTGSSSDYMIRFSTASSMVMHSPLFDLGVPDRPVTPLSDSEIDGSSVRRLSQFGGSVTSVDTVASDGAGPTSPAVSAVGFRRSMSPPPSTISSRVLSDNLRRSLSSGSRRPKRISQLSIPGSVSSQDIEDELLESYFHGGMSPTSIPSAIVEEQETAVVTPGREHFRGALPHPTDHPKPFQNRPPGQFHLPWTPPLISTQIMEKQQRAAAAAAQRASPPPSACSNTSFVSLDSSIMSPPTAASSTFSEETSYSSFGDAVAIKAVLNDSIVKFRIDRSAPLQDVRAKLYEKFVKEQDVPLSDSFSLAHQPASGGRLMALKYAGRTRSNSVSSVGTLDSNHLRYIFSEKEWQDAMSCCGAKLNLHVFSDKI